MTKKTGSKFAEFWKSRVGAFAEACGVELTDVEKALDSVIGKPSEQGLTFLADEEFSPEDELKQNLCLDKDGPQIKTAFFRANLHLLRGPKAAAPKVDDVVEDVFSSLLPEVPVKESFLKALLRTGELKVDDVSVTAGIRAYWANKLGMNDVVGKLKNKLDDVLHTMEEPAQEGFYALMDHLTTAKYADVLAACGVGSSMRANFVNKERTALFMDRMETVVIPTLSNFQTRLDTWVTSWLTQANVTSQLEITELLKGLVTGQAIRPSVMQCRPDWKVMEDLAKESIIGFNKAFSGDVVPVARATAYQSEKVAGFLNDEKLLAQLRMKNRDELVKLLGIEVGFYDERLEGLVCQYALAILRLAEGKVTEPYQYLLELCYKGRDIIWSRIDPTAPKAHEVTDAVSRRPIARRID